MPFITNIIAISRILSRFAMLVYLFIHQMSMSWVIIIIIIIIIITITIIASS